MSHRAEENQSRHKQEKKEYNSSKEVLFDDQKYVRLDEPFFGEDGRSLWGKYIQNGDAQGFDLTYVGPNGEHVERVVLPVSTKVVRYGNERGSFTTEPGTPYDLLSMPFVESSLPYHEYIVIGKCEVLCFVTKGRVAPGFQSKGGAVQYFHDHTMRESIRLGILKEDWSWLE